MKNNANFHTEDELISQKKKRRLKITLGVLGGIIFVFVIFYFSWARPKLREPISEPLTLPLVTLSAPDSPEVEQVAQSPEVQYPPVLPEAPVFHQPTHAPQAKPVCGKDTEWIVLMVGIDYRGDGYLYGLADSIRLIRIDFVNMTVNMVALPRDLIVEAPEGRFTAPDPFKINQAYLFGTPGMGHYLGSGLGAGALSEVIYFNFGIPVDHYGVINFATLINFIDAIDGVEIDLPSPVAGGYFGDFPSGTQTLNGERALALSMIREGYSDAFRVRNQTMIMRAALNKLIKPAYWLQVPVLLNEFGNSFLTDLSIEELTSLSVCFLRNFSRENLKTFEAPEGLLTGSSAFIPTLNNNAFVYLWDERFLDWMHNALLQE